MKDLPFILITQFSQKHDLIFILDMVSSNAGSGVTG